LLRTRDVLCQQRLCPEIAGKEHISKDANISDNKESSHSACATLETTPDLHPKLCNLTFPSPLDNAIELMTTNNGHINQIHYMLILGSPGSGKTHFCNTVERRGDQMPRVSSTSYLVCYACDDGSYSIHFSSFCKVIRPKLPVDILGSTVGSLEDRLIYLFEHPLSLGIKNKIILIFDNIEEIIGKTRNELIKIANDSHEGLTTETLKGKDSYFMLSWKR